MEIEKTNKISQPIESDATPLSPESSVLFEITHKVTQDGDHVTNYDEDKGQVMDDIQDSIALGRTRRKIHVSPVSSLLT